MTHFDTIKATKQFVDAVENGKATDITVAEFKQQLNMAELILRLQSHDWNYEYSDDNRAWVAGRASLEKIRSFKRIVGAETYKKLYNQYAPNGHKINP